MLLQSDYHFEYTACDVLGSRWRVAVPNKEHTCTGLPDPVKGTQCSEFLTYVWLECSVHVHVNKLRSCDSSLLPAQSLFMQRGWVSQHADAGVPEVCSRDLLSGHRSGFWWVGQSACWFHHPRGDDKRLGQPNRLLQVSEIIHFFLFTHYCLQITVFLSVF